MTKEETIKIMAMLNAFYAGGKNDPKMQATAWHLVLGKYDYNTACKAVIRFAENDTRQYATFPSVGLIVAEIKAVEKDDCKPIDDIVYAISYGRSYDMLPADARRLISEDSYGEWLGMDAEEFSNHIWALKRSLKGNQQKLLGEANG